MVYIIPTILTREKKELDEKLKKLTKISKRVQIDFMDGQFVKSRSIKLSDIPNLNNYENVFEAHLMVKDPKKWVPRLKNKGFEKIIFHYEALENNKKVLDLVNEIHKKDMKAFIAINPSTREEKIFPFLNEADGILIMGVHPGRSGQSLLSKTYHKILGIRNIRRNANIQVDGGVRLGNAANLVKHGVKILNSGSYVSDSKNPKEALVSLRREVRKVII